jgi:hypothetical protein
MPKKTLDSRPRIWTEGRQHPPLEPRSFALASVRLARDGLAGLLGRCAQSAAEFAHEVTAGVWRIPEHRLGHTGRLLPSHGHLGRAVATGSALLAEAAAAVQPSPPAARESEPALPHRPEPRRPAGTETGDPDLAAIRALMAEGPRPAAAPAPAGEQPPRPPVPRLIGLLSWPLAYGLLVMSVPYGAVRAALAHLDGQDLRDLVDDAGSA